MEGLRNNVLDKFSGYGAYLCNADNEILFSMLTKAGAQMALLIGYFGNHTMVVEQIPILSSEAEPKR